MKAARDAEPLFETATRAAFLGQEHPMNPETTGPEIFANAVQHVTFGPLSTFQNLSVVPLLSANPSFISNSRGAMPILLKRAA